MPLIYTDVTSAISTLDELKTQTLYCLAVSSRGTTDNPIHEGSLLKLCSNEIGRGFLGSVAVTGNMTIDKIKTNYNNVPITKSVITEILDSKDVSIQSTAGEQGFTGLRGYRADQGPTGAQGLLGVQGEQGRIGIQGAQGITGPDGKSGGDGLQGVTGAQGIIGYPGVRGYTGVQGITGDQGYEGYIGVTGLQGRTGLQGTIGPVGSTGCQGPIGPDSEYDVPDWDRICQALSMIKIGVSGVFSCQSIDAAQTVNSTGFFES